MARKRQYRDDDEDYQDAREDDLRHANAAGHVEPNPPTSAKKLKAKLLR